jgi:cell division protein FtsW
MIAAVIGEELGLVGLLALVGLFGLFGYAGLRTAQRARDRYTKLLAAGLTSMVLVQAIVNLFAVLGLAPLTGVPLPFVSYGNSSLLVMLASTGLLLNIARGGTAAAPARRRDGAARLRVVDGGRGARGRASASRGRSVSGGGKSRDSRGGNRGTRRAGTGRRRRAAR